MQEMPYSHRDAVDEQNIEVDVFLEELRLRETSVAYAAAVKCMTNYEVWRNVQSAISARSPGLELEAGDWRSLRILLDELNWRRSGLEGPGSSSGKLSNDICEE
jgi:hypothetical protein